MVMMVLHISKFMAIDSFILKEHEHKLQNKAMNVNFRHMCATEYFIAHK